MSVSISLSSFFPALPQAQDLYAKAMHLAKQYIQPGTLDWIELLGPGFVGAGYQVFLEGFSSLIRLPNLKECIMTVGALGTIALYQKYLKIPFIKREIQAVIESSKKNDQTVLIFRSFSADWIAFKTHSNLDKYQKLGKNFSIEVFESSSKQDRHYSQDQLASQKKKYNRIDFHNHGSPDCLQLGPGDIISTGSIGFFEWLNDRIKPGGTIVLDVCQAGKGLENIARCISKFCPEATVLASSDDIHGYLGSEYDRHGTPSFNNGTFFKGKDITRIYRDGNLVKG